MAASVETLHEALDRLKAWLASLGGFPGWKDVRVIEIGRGTRYEKDGDGPYVWRVAEGAISTPAKYAGRFEELLGAGYSWINLSCYGLLGDLAIVAVELPREMVGVPRGKTAVNLSGPPVDVKDGGARWDADGYVLVVPE